MVPPGSCDHCNLWDESTRGNGVFYAQSAAGDVVERSVWSITSFDSAPIKDALPKMGLEPVESRPNEMAVRKNASDEIASVV